MHNSAKILFIILNYISITVKREWTQYKLIILRGIMKIDILNLGAVVDINRAWETITENTVTCRGDL
jgi:hypothetical protein